MKTRHFAFIAVVAALCLSLNLPSSADSIDQSENVQNYIKHSDFVVDICIYEQEWIPATTEFPKAKLVRRGVVTGVHKGDIQVGMKLEYYHLIENPPKLFQAFRSVVDGELRTFFFSKDDGSLKDGKYTLEGDGHFGFDRCKGALSEAFRRELKINPDLKHHSEQVAPSDGDNKPPN
jgi:hypothetical protein